MQIDIITLFPSMFIGPFDESIIKRAKEKGLVEIYLHNLRDWAIDNYGTVDDKPYGGGVGMVLRPEPIVAALRHLKDTSDGDSPSADGHGSSEVSDMRKTILLSASGKLFTQRKAVHLSRLSHLILICGHYEGVDQRIADYYIDEEISIGDYVLTGGEIPAMVVVDSVVRLIPGVLSKEEAIRNESFSIPFTSDGSLRNTSEVARRDSSDGGERKKPINLLESPHYTRPDVFENHQVPEVLRSGNHKEIENWRREQSLKRTKKNRPDLLSL